MGTADATGTAFKTSFVRDADPVFFEPIDIRGAKVETWLVLTCIHAGPVIDNPNMRFLIHTKTVQKKFVFNLNAHFTLLHPSHRIHASFIGEISCFIFFQMSFCFFFLGVPSTVSILRAAKPQSPGRRVKSS